MNKYLKNYGRKLDYYAMLDDDKGSTLLVKELKKYQNIDGGFGHGLEIDIQAPVSNIPSTDVAIQYLRKLEKTEEIALMIDGIISYYEQMFDADEHRWYMVEKDVDAYPRAIWWNYDNRLSFGVLNPTPEILGFLHQHQEKVTSIDLDQEIKLMVDRILELLPLSEGFHDVLSVLRFYRDIPYIRSDIFDTLYAKTQEFLNERENAYHLRAHQVASIAPEFVTKAQREEDIEKLQMELAKEGYIACTWQWFQYDDAFAKIKPYWNAFLTREALEHIAEFSKDKDC